MAKKQLNVSEIDAKLLALKAEQRELAKVRRKAVTRERKAAAEAAEKAKREEALKLYEWAQRQKLTVNDGSGNKIEKTVLDWFRGEPARE